MKKLLLYLKSSEKGVIVDIAGCDKSCRRLRELGLTKGAEILVVKNDVGPLIISMKGQKIAIGQGLAGKVVINTLINSTK